ncbi:hypothetical protein [Sphaerisporangium sp. TRM90804]|uniref:hypothetical protein n=1 Tax=Sphaerisporangium sp. TRM90804 TaxID=3031113 RepID=UPI002449EBE4|nr:hypothetical protein [Sphaerisporangium sp. TRM90804]MDH2428340.1 hypothetical protein [Sphaerisporangium sp. TRM90804]
MSEPIEAQGHKVVELFGACGAAPDDLEVARAADEALRILEDMLLATETPARRGLNGVSAP